VTPGSLSVCAIDADCSDGFVCEEGSCIAAPLADAGTPPADGGADVDGGPSLDAGPPNDGGAVDAGLVDGGADAGPELDAGLVSPDGVPAGWFHITHTQGEASSCLESGETASSGAILKACESAAGQSWRAERIDDGGVVLKSKHQGDRRCLDGKSADAGSAMEACVSAAGQQWDLVPSGDDFLLKTRELGAGACLTADALGAGGVAMASCTTSPDQLWRLEPVEMGCASSAECGARHCDFYSGLCSDELVEQYCLEGVDDDDDDLTDCADPDCARTGACDQAVTVPNGSFEMGTPPDAATGWTSNNNDGTGGTSAGDVGFSAAADGAQYHFVNLPVFNGPDPSETQSDDGQIGSALPGRYTLTVAVGRRDNDATTDGTLELQLLSDSTVVGSTTVVDPFSSFSPGSWNDVVTTAFVSPGDGVAGGDLSVRLAATDGTGGIRSQGQFDAVRLRHAPLVEIVVPNGSFEDPFAPQDDQATGWNPPNGSHFVGIDAFDQGFAAAADGVQFYYMNLSGFGGLSVTSVRSDPGLIGPAAAGFYALTVALGRRTNDVTLDGTVRMELLAGEKVIAITEVDDPRGRYNPGTWNDVTAVGVVSAGASAEGDDLSVRITAIEGTASYPQAQVDDIRLHYVSAGPPAFGPVCDDAQAPCGLANACACVLCVNNGICAGGEHCVCGDCAGAGRCTACDDDGVCDLQTERCDCADCAGLPQCG
jgi:hypothetical protein